MHGVASAGSDVRGVSSVIATRSNLLREGRPVVLKALAKLRGHKLNVSIEFGENSVKNRLRAPISELLIWLPTHSIQALHDNITQFKDKALGRSADHHRCRSKACLVVSCESLFDV